MKRVQIPLCPLNLYISYVLYIHMYEKICPFCKEKIIYERGILFSNHCADCKSGPNYKNKIEKIRQLHFIRSGRKDYIFNCKKCGKEYKLNLTLREYQKNYYKIFCSHHCANSRIHTIEQNKKVSDKLKGRKLTDVQSKRRKELFKNKIISNETRLKISNRLIDFYKNNPNERIKKSLASKGRIIKFETRRKMSLNAMKNEFGGKRNSKRYKYTNNGEIITLDSTYELKVAESLDKNNIKWIRPKFMLWTDKNGKQHRYYPDFYLTEYNVYLDPKNDYLLKIDSEKIKIIQEQNNINIILLNHLQLIWEEIYKLIRQDEPSLVKAPV